MKKRLISVILTLCLIVSLLGSLAYAELVKTEDNIIYYKMNVGDTVGNICRSLGIDFEANRKVISFLNNYPKWNNMSVGTIVKIPTSDYKYSAANTGTSSATTGTTTGSTTAASLQSGDFVAYYLVNHTVQQGETLGTICAQYNTNYGGVNATTIKSVNNLTNINKIYTGQNLLIPCSSVPSGASVAAVVVGHKIQSGETVASICAAYNVAFDQATLKSLNPSVKNLNKITAGSTFYLMTSAANAPSGSSSSSATPVNSGSEKYDIKAAPATHGGFEMQVSGKAVTKACAGEKITVSLKPDYSYIVGQVTVTAKNGTAVTVDKNYTFTMPASEVTVSVDFYTSKTFEIVKASAKNGSFKVYANGTEASKSEAGKTITVSTTADKDYELKSIQYTTEFDTKGEPVWTNAKNVIIEVGNTGKFTMPDSKVAVQVEYAVAKSHEVKVVVSPANADDEVKARVAGNVISSCFAAADASKQKSETGKAYAGQTVAIEAIPASSDRKVNRIEVVETANTSNKQTISGTSFIMPSYDCTINVYFDGKVKATPSAATNGTLEIVVGGSPFSTAKTVEPGETVIVKATPKAGYDVDTIEVTSADGPVPYDAVSKSFVMPNKDVTVKATFKEKVYAVTITAPEHGKLTADKINAKKGETVTFTATPDDGYVIAPDCLVVERDDKTDTQKTSNSTYTYTMQEGNVTASVKFVPAMYEYKALSFEDANGNTVSGASGTLTNKSNSDKEVALNVAVSNGDTLKLTIEVPDHYTTKSLVVRDTLLNVQQTIKLDKSKTAEFKMPKCDLNLQVVFDDILYPAKFSSGGSAITINGLAGTETRKFKCGTTLSVIVEPPAGKVIDWDNTYVSDGAIKWTAATGDLNWDASTHKLTYGASKTDFAMNDIGYDFHIVFKAP